MVSTSSESVRCRCASVSPEAKRQHQQQPHMTHETHTHLHNNIIFLTRTGCVCRLARNIHIIPHIVRHELCLCIPHYCCQHLHLHRREYNFNFSARPSSVDHGSIGEFVKIFQYISPSTSASNIFTIFFMRKLSRVLDRRDKLC